MKPPAPPQQHLRLSDLRGAARLATLGVQGAAKVAEGVHTSVLRTIGLPVRSAKDGSAGGLTGLIYGGVRRAAGLVGSGIDAALNQLQGLAPVPGEAAPSSRQREAALAAINGVLGDQLEAEGNPLATRMSLRMNGAALDYAALGAAPVGGKILLLVHGLCMNDMQWQPKQTLPKGEPPTAAQDYASWLAQNLGYQPIYLRYNSGRHISDNGRELSAQLQRLVALWPQPITEIAVVAHSMGGLVVRSACAQALQQPLESAASGHPGWPSLLRKIAFLGTPHHGAPLERAGNLVDMLLEATRWSAPLAKLGQLRSAGITDLRRGNLLAQDWAGQGRFDTGADTRTPVPLPPGVACFAVAASTTHIRSDLAGQPRSQNHALRDRVLGDGLVPVPSALGQHPDEARQLAFTPEHLWIAQGMGHLQLLSDARVGQRLLAWFAQPNPGA